MSTRPPMRCVLIASMVRCTNDATHRLLDSEGSRVSGAVYCEPCAQRIIDAYRDKQGWTWTMEPLDAQAARIAELEAALRFYADSEWSWDGDGRPVIEEAADHPAYHGKKYGADPARSALKEATDE